VNYDDWNRVVTDHFFPVRDTPTPVYLSVDDALLTDLMSSRVDRAVAELDAVSDFQKAIRAVVYGRDPFDQISSRARRWRRDGADGDPPFIAVLAATVLAASRMHRSEDARVGKLPYYKPLRHLLGLNDATGMPEGYDTTIPALWKHLAWWLTGHQQGRRGLPSAVTHPTEVNIGWSVSQAVLLGPDRAQVGLFLSFIRVKPGDTMPEAELLSRFEEWARLTRVSTRIQRALETPALRPILATILHQELSHYGGLVRDTAILPNVTVSMATDDGGMPYSLAIRVPSDFRVSSLNLHGTTISSARPGATLGGRHG
jgi:hypothetical protein